jgi:hypothetical protein
MFRANGEQVHETFGVLVGLAAQPRADRRGTRWQRNAEECGQLALCHGQVASHVLINDLERGDRVGGEPIPPPGLAFFRVPRSRAIASRSNGGGGAGRSPSASA